MIPLCRKAAWDGISRVQYVKYDFVTANLFSHEPCVCLAVVSFLKYFTGVQPTYKEHRCLSVLLSGPTRQAMLSYKTCLQDHRWHSWLNCGVLSLCTVRRTCNPLLVAAAAAAAAASSIFGRHALLLLPWPHGYCLQREQECLG